MRWLLVKIEQDFEDLMDWGDGLDLIFKNFLDF
jgi:hypothetical protein